MKKEEFIERYGIEKYQEKLEKQKEYLKQYREKNADKIAEYFKQWSETHKDKISEQVKEWTEKHKEHKKEYLKLYRTNNKDKIKECNKQYKSTLLGRAKNLVSTYKHHDKIFNRGECTLTSEWIIDNIFNSKCYWCGETDWKKLGCDRIDNTKPHTPNNVICSCSECNIKRGKKEFIQYESENR